MTDDEAPTPAWLTDALRRAGVLPRGHVTTIDWRATAAFNSFTSHLTPVYSADAPADSPARLLLKRNRPAAWSVAAGAREVAFYRVAASHPIPLAMIVRWYAAEIDDQTGDSYLLLEDLSLTHQPPLTRDQQLTAGRNVPSEEAIEKVINALAGFHAAWWEHPALGQGVAGPGHWYTDRAAWERYMQRRATAWANLIAAEASWFPAEMRHLYEHLLARLPGLWDSFLAPRLTARAAVTLTHGDAYFANFLCPRDPTTGGAAHLIDWQSPETYLGASDLATLIATFWTSEQRHGGQREERMLRRYLATLTAAGVTNYTWEMLLTDYRFALIEWMLVALQDRDDGARMDYWWPKMQCLVAAYRDHGAADLLPA